MSTPVKYADLIMLATERRDLGLDDGSFWDLFYRGSVLANLLPVEVVTKTGSLSTLSLSQTVP